MFIVLDQSDSPSHEDDIGDNGTNWNSDSDALDEALNQCNENIQSCPPLTDFHTGRLIMVKGIYPDVWFVL